VGLQLDPEVAALLDDLPPIKLPPALVAEGWGQRSSRDYPFVGTRKQPSDVQQPIYTDTCVQCGRPLTMNARQFWADHAGRVFCNNVLLDEPVLDYHVTQHDLDVGWRTVQEFPPLVPTRKKDEPPIPKAKCSATKHWNKHVHTCPHPEGHFGFHECIECRHLWR
jgi:hypothetical protein